VTEFSVAPFVASRIASLPGAALDLDQRLTGGMLAEACRLQERVDSVSREVAAAIHALVPACSDADRRALLALRRDLHNHRQVQAAGRDAAERHGVHLDELLQRRVASVTARDIVIDTTMDDSTRAEEQVRELLRTPDVADALRLLSPGFFAAIAKPAPAGSKRGRSAVGFAARATLKPSPLSTLTRSAVVGADLRDRVSTLSPVVALYIVRELATRRRALPALQYRSAVRAVDEQLVASVETAGMAHGTVVFGREPKRLHSADDDAALLSRWGGGDEDELLRLAGDGGWQRAERWIGSGAVHAVLPWTHDDGPPESVLGGQMLRSASSEVAEAGTLLLRIGQDAAAVASTSGVARSALIGSIQTSLHRLASDLDIEFPQERLVNEDAGATAGSEVPSDGLADSLATLIRPTLFRSRVYDVLRDAFLSEHGPGGTARNVMAFLTGCSLSRPLRAALQAARTADRAADGHLGRTDLPVGATTAPPTISVFVQHAHEPDDGPTVVNQLMPGLGGVVARFSGLGDARTTLVPMISSWVDRLYPNVEQVRSVLPGVAVNPLQRAAAPAVPPLRGADLEGAFDGIALTHDPARDVLEFVDLDGALIAPVPLGIVPAWTFDGPVGLLLALLDPWIDGSQITREANPIRRAYRSDRAERRPRRTEQSIITRRETWRIPVQDLPLQGDLAPGAFLIALHEWRTANGMPEEVFVRVHGDDPFDAATRKPMWMRFTSWYAVSAVWALLPGRHTLELQESLPVRSVADRAQEMVLTLGWPRPVTEETPVRSDHALGTAGTR
jgi:hypothetical protein